MRKRVRKLVLYGEEMCFYVFGGIVLSKRSISLITGNRDTVRERELMKQRFKLGRRSASLNCTGA
jgi:hypothetical protein